MSFQGNSMVPVHANLCSIDRPLSSSSVPIQLLRYSVSTAKSIIRLRRYFRCRSQNVACFEACLIHIKMPDVEALVSGLILSLIIPESFESTLSG
jgi:hypothetical protein